MTTVYDINTGNERQMKELIYKLAEGEQSSFFTDEGDYAILVREDGGARLHISQDEKPSWDIVIYYNTEGAKEGEGVKRSIINQDAVAEVEQLEKERLERVKAEKELSYHQALKVLANTHRTSVSNVRNVLKERFDNR